MIYLFIGQDSPYRDSPLSAKDFQLKQIKEESLPKKVEQFNLDTLYAPTLKLKELQEKLLLVPVKSSKRMVIIKNAQELSREIEDFIVRWAKEPHKEIILLLDIETQNRKEALVKALLKYAKIFRFKEIAQVSTFNLSRYIDQRRTDYALKVLGQLLNTGERPERVLGGLRYNLEKSRLSPLELKRRVRLLVESDVAIKTGKIKPAFILEKLIVRLCSLVQPFH